MLSASPAVPLSSIEFAPNTHGRRLSLTTAHGRQFFTHRDGLPSPDVLTPIGGTPHGSGAATPVGSSSDSEPHSNSRRGSGNDLRQQERYDEDNSLHKVNSRGGIWHNVSTSNFLLFRSRCSFFGVSRCRVQVVGGPSSSDWVVECRCPNVALSSAEINLTAPLGCVACMLDAGRRSPASAVCFGATAENVPMPAAAAACMLISTMLLACFHACMLRVDDARGSAPVTVGHHCWQVVVGTGGCVI
jgi:hypothetical protein